MKEKNIKQDIYKFLVINNLIVWALVAAFCFSIIVLFNNQRKLTNELLQKVLVINFNGEVIPAKWQNRMDNIHIEIKEHINQFHYNFYTYDGFNMDKKIEKSLWLADKTAEDLYIKRKNDGWFNRVKMYNINQEIIIEPQNITVKGNDEPFYFEVLATLIISQDNRSVKYSFTTTGNIIFVNRNFPLNPHGFLITNFNENNREELNENGQN